MCSNLHCVGLEFLDKDDTIMTGKNLGTATMYSFEIFDYKFNKIRGVGTD